MRTVTISAIVPVDKLVLPGMSAREKKPFKTLYLLHGIFGNYTDWLSGTRIQSWAEERDLAVIMPSGENAFYVDNNIPGGKYGEFIGRELVEFTRNLFPLSRKREDTFIAGLSMGGYGALRNGLKYNEVFGALAGLSCAFILEGAPTSREDAPFPFARKSYLQSVFGDLDTVLESDKNPKWIVKMLKERNSPIPLIYLCCGTEDNLICASRDFHNFLSETGVEHVYEEGPGIHDWIFWDTYIKKVLDWLPLENPQAGVGSGNVRV